jgi:hypothetical protein
LSPIKIQEFGLRPAFTVDQALDSCLVYVQIVVTCL